MRRAFIQRFTAVSVCHTGSVGQAWRWSGSAGRQACEDRPLGRQRYVVDVGVFEVPDEYLEPAKELICRVMENALELAVPLVVNAEVGHSLAKE